MVADVKKKTKAKVTEHAAQKSFPPFIRASDYSDRRVGFPNMHITVAVEAMTHAERAKGHRTSLRLLFGDLHRVVTDGEQAAGTGHRNDCMVAALNYASQIMQHGAQADAEQAQAQKKIDEVTHFVDMKLATPAFYSRFKHAIARTMSTSKRARRRRSRP